MKLKCKENWLPTAVTIALLPPLWAVISEYIGISFGWCALAGAGIYVAAGDNIKNAPKISGGFIMGSIWGVAATKMIGSQLLPHSLLVFLTLCVLGFAAVFLSINLMDRFTYLPAWLGSWALSIGVMGTGGERNLVTLVKLIIALLVGVWYVGAFSSYITHRISNAITAAKGR